MGKYRIGPHARFDCKVHLVWIPNYRKPVLVGPVALRVRDLIRQIAMERELEIIPGKVARDHVHLLLACRPHQDISTMVQWLKGTTSRILPQEFAHLRKQFWGRYLWAGGYFAVTSGNITHQMIQEYIAGQEGEPVQDDSRFRIDDPPYLPPSRRWLFSRVGGRSEKTSRPGRPCSCIF